MDMDGGRVGDALSVQASPAPIGEILRIQTAWEIQRWDEDQTSWASRKLGGDCAGKHGFLQPTSADFRQLKISPYNTSHIDGNLITHAGWARVMNLLTATATGYAMSSANTRIGVGTATAAANGTDTALGATGTNCYYMTASAAPTVTTGTASQATGTGTIAYVAVFATGVANFAWAEFGTDIGNGPAAGTSAPTLLFNHKISDQSTKASGQTWTATETFTFTSS